MYLQASGTPCSICFTIRLSCAFNVSFSSWCLGVRCMLCGVQQACQAKFSQDALSGSYPTASSMTRTSAHTAHLMPSFCGGAVRGTFALEEVIPAIVWHLFI